MTDKLTALVSTLVNYEKNKLDYWNELFDIKDSIHKGFGNYLNLSEEDINKYLFLNPEKPLTEKQIMLKPDDEFNLEFSLDLKLKPSKINSVIEDKLIVLKMNISKNNRFINVEFDTKFYNPYDRNSTDTLYLDMYNYVLEKLNNKRYFFERSI